MPVKRKRSSNFATCTNGSLNLHKRKCKIMKNVSEAVWDRTFENRKNTLMRKAQDLELACGIAVTITVQSRSGITFYYASNNKLNTMLRESGILGPRSFDVANTMNASGITINERAKPSAEVPPTRINLSPPKISQYKKHSILEAMQRDKPREAKQSKFDNQSSKRPNKKRNFETDIIILPPDGKDGKVFKSTANRCDNLNDSSTSKNEPVKFSGNKPYSIPTFSTSRNKPKGKLTVISVDVLPKLSHSVTNSTKSATTADGFLDINISSTGLSSPKTPKSNFIKENKDGPRHQSSNILDEPELHTDFFTQTKAQQNCGLSGSLAYTMASNEQENEDIAISTAWPPEDFDVMSCTASSQKSNSVIPNKEIVDRHCKKADNSGLLHKSNVLQEIECNNNELHDSVAKNTDKSDSCGGTDKTKMVSSKNDNAQESLSQMCLEAFEALFTKNFLDHNIEFKEYVKKMENDEKGCSILQLLNHQPIFEGFRKKLHDTITKTAPRPKINVEKRKFIVKALSKSCFLQVCKDVGVKRRM